MGIFLCGAFPCEAWLDEELELQLLLPVIAKWNIELEGFFVMR